MFLIYFRKLNAAFYFETGKSFCYERFHNPIGHLILISIKCFKLLELAHLFAGPLGSGAIQIYLTFSLLYSRESYF